MGKIVEGPYAVFPLLCFFGGVVKLYETHTSSFNEPEQQQQKQQQQQQQQQQQHQNDGITFLEGVWEN